MIYTLYFTHFCIFLPPEILRALSKSSSICKPPKYFCEAKVSDLKSYISGKYRIFHFDQILMHQKEFQGILKLLNLLFINISPRVLSEYE